MLKKRKNRLLNTACTGFAFDHLLTHVQFIEQASMNISKTENYLHITGANADNVRIDQMLEPQIIPLNHETCPLPHSTSYISVNRNHFVKDVKNIDFDEMESADSDTEWEEQEYQMLDYLMKEIPNANKNIKIMADLENIFGLKKDWIFLKQKQITFHRKNEHRIQKKRLFNIGYDAKNTEMPLDTFQLLFCTRCMTYDCILHGLQNPRKSNRYLPNNIELERNLDYFGTMNDPITNVNAFANVENNHSLNNDMIQYLLPKDYKLSVEYPSDMSQCQPCSPECYISYLDNNVNDDDIQSEWKSMEKANLRRLLNMCKKNFCQISVILGSKSCAQIYLKTLEWIPNLKTYYNPMSDVINVKKVGKRKRNPSRITLDLGLSVDDSFHCFMPCKHSGVCSALNNCSCVKNRTYCEKFCGCERDCSQKHPGCQCQSSRCRTRACPCFVSNRECDPDICQSCHSYLPPLIFNAVIDWLKTHSPKFYAENYKYVRYSIVDKKSETEEKVSESESKLITILGVPNINPYHLCSNVSCTQQRRKKLWIGKSRIHGFGCFAGEIIFRNEYITEYLGEVISQEEADRRGKVYDKMNLSYLFNLNAEYCIDAARKGCKIKFANHSNSPNCKSKIMMTNGDHRICIYALKTLQVGEELTFNYRHGSTESAGAEPQWHSSNISD